MNKIVNIVVYFIGASTLYTKLFSGNYSNINSASQSCNKDMYLKNMIFTFSHNIEAWCKKTSSEKGMAQLSAQVAFKYT